MEKRRPYSYGFKDLGSREATMARYRRRFVVALLGGVLGIHKFMDRKIAWGIVYLFTGGLFLVGWAVDVVGAVVDLIMLRRIYAGTLTEANASFLLKREIAGQRLASWLDKPRAALGASRREAGARRRPSAQERVPDYDVMSGREFEEFVARVLRANGFTQVRLTAESADRGVDLTATKGGRRYAIQCKRYKSKVGNAAVQQAYSGKDIYGCDVAVVATNNYFTEQATQDARALRVELWDRTTLERLIKALR